MKTPIKTLYLAFAVACFVLESTAKATCQDACLTNDNTVQGDDALISVTTAFDNTAIGSQALMNDTAGPDNTATGFRALWVNTTGDSNTANGSQSLASNTTGTWNTAIGFNSLISNNVGGSNVAVGRDALFANTSGSSNVTVGTFALNFNTTGSNNIALGGGAGTNLTTGSNNIDIGNVGVAAEANIIRIGTQGIQRKAFIAGISATGVSGRAVMITGTGQLGVAPSSVRFKENIKHMDKASEAILSLKPVTFRYKKEIDQAGTSQFGLVAEDVEKVNPDLVARDDQGKPYTVRYEAVNAMLLNEFLKAHRKVQELEANDAQQQNAIKSLTAMVKAQALQIQKVSAQVELNKPPIQTLADNQ